MHDRPETNDDGTLTRSITKTMLMIRNRGGENNLFATLPDEIIKRIKYSPSPDPEFLEMLSYAARGEFDKLKQKLDHYAAYDVEKLKQFLLEAGDVVTRSGLLVQGTTILKCAFGERDPRMVATIKPYFDLFAGGDRERESQLERCREAMARPRNEKPYGALKRLINAIKNSPLMDIRAALEKRYEDCNEELRNAFIEFRTVTTLKTLTNPGMHDDPEILIEAFKLLFEDEWKNLITRDESNNNSYDKHDLIWRQVIGWLMRNLVGVHRFVFAQDHFKEDTDSDPMSRATNVEGTPVCKYYNADSFPDTFPSDGSLSGLGFDYGTCGGGVAHLRARAPSRLPAASGIFSNFMSNNNLAVSQNLAPVS